MAVLKSGLIILLLKVVQGQLHITLNGKNISGPVKIIEGEDLLLNCTASFPYSMFIWTKDGTDLSDGYRMEIKQIQVQDEGVYNCKASQSDNSSYVENMQVSVEVLYYTDKCQNVDVKDASKNMPLFILVGIGWLGFVMSGLLHIITCTKNRNKKACNAAENRSSLEIAKRESSLASSCYTSHVRIPDNPYSYVYDQLSIKSFSDGRSASSNSTTTTISTVPSYDSVKQDSSNDDLHVSEL